MTDSEKIDIWNTFNRFQRSREKSFAPKINKALRHQVQQFISAKKAGATDQQALQNITSTQLLTVLKHLYLDAGIIYGAKELARLKREKARMPIGFNELITQLMEQYFKFELLNVVESITSTTRQMISDILIKSYAAGDSFDEITDKITALSFTYARARMIARTETVTAANQGAAMAAKTTGLKMNKIWISAQDNRTRRHPRDKYDHLTMDGVTIQSEVNFIVDGEVMAQPGDRKHGAKAGNICNCRCTFGHIPVRENGKLVYTEFGKVA